MSALWDGFLRLAPYIAGAFAIAYAVRHPAAPEGVDPDYWRRAYKWHWRRRRAK